jgi:hypothetical protein
MWVPVNRFIDGYYAINTSHICYYDSRDLGMEVVSLDHLQLGTTGISLGIGILVLIIATVIGVIASVVVKYEYCNKISKTISISKDTDDPKLILNV